MKIYTKQGDQGETGLLGGERVSKDHLRIRAYGTLDELNAAVGLGISAAATPAEWATRLCRVQGEIFQLGAELATPRGKATAAAVIDTSEVDRLEQEIDIMEKGMTPLRSFILPGGTLASAHLHLARTICRRAERELVVLHRAESQRAVVMQYVNRLSDYLFVVARFVNAQAGIPDIAWNAPAPPAN